MVAENRSVCRSAGVAATIFFTDGPEAHVEHAVGLVQHEHAHVVQMDGLLLHEVDEAPGRGDEHVDAMPQPLDLRLIGQAAHHGEDAVMRGHGDGGAYFADLLGQFACRA